MEWLAIEDVPYQGPPSPAWRSDRPLDRMLVAVGLEGAPVVISRIGPGLDQAWEWGEDLSEWAGACGLEPGIWVVDCRLAVYEAWSYYGREIESELEPVGEARPASPEEIQAATRNEWPWDPELWMSNWPQIRDWRWPEETRTSP